MFFKDPGYLPIIEEEKLVIISFYFKVSFHLNNLEIEITKIEKNKLLYYYIYCFLLTKIEF